MIVLVTGANGQLGKSIKKISADYPSMRFIFTDVEELDICNKDEVMSFFSENKLAYCINAAAYTNVDKAETDRELNNKINIEGPRNLALAASKYYVKLIHISSDYVYGDDGSAIMDEAHITSPKGQYAIAKLQGEEAVRKHTGTHYIIRTSWLYSEFGNNFLKTIIRLLKERPELNVVDDQIGSPTYAGDLAQAILDIISKDNNSFGIYNYSNCGFTSWYGFTTEISKYIQHNCKINPIPSSQYPTPAPRPLNSKMSKRKIINAFDLSIPEWQKSLKKCMAKL